jgi:hypothetical protein
MDAFDFSEEITRLTGVGVDPASGPDRTVYSLLLMQRDATRCLVAASERWTELMHPWVIWRAYCLTEMHCGPLLLTWSR